MSLIVNRSKYAIVFIIIVPMLFLINLSNVQPFLPQNTDQDYNLQFFQGLVNHDHEDFNINQIYEISFIVQEEYEVEITPRVPEFFYTALIVLLLLPFFIIYLLPKNNTPHLNKSGILKLFLLNTFFLSVFLIMELVSNPLQENLFIPFFHPDTSRFLIVSFLWLWIYVTILFPYYCDLLRQIVVYESKLDNQPLIVAISNSVEKLRGKRIIEREQIPNFFQFHIPGAYYLKYKLNVLIGERDDNSKLTKVSFTFSHSIRNLNMIRILMIAIFGLVLIARAYWTLSPPIMSVTVDSELTFTILVFIFVFFNLLLAFTCENLVFQREEVYKKSLTITRPDLKITKPDLDEIRRKARAKLAIPEEKPSLQDIKRKAQEKYDLSIQKAEKEKQERIDTILGRADSKLNKQISPEVIRMETLIRETRKILNATPEINSIKLEDIVVMLGSEKTDIDEIEQMIIGLVNRKEVRGEYNIWTKDYSGGNTRTRFINRTLEDLKINKEEISSLNVSGDKMEIVFRDQEKTTISHTEKKAKKKTTKK